MKKTTLATIIVTIMSILFVISASKTFADDTTEAIKCFCEEKWNTDYEMQQYCRSQMQRGLLKLSKMVGQYDEYGEEYKIINRCWAKWYPQLDMVAYCAKKQLEAYEGLK